MPSEADKEDRARLSLQKLLLPALMKKLPTTDPSDSTDMQVESDSEFKPVSIELAPLCVRVSIAAQMIGVGKTKLYELMEAGEVKTLKMGKSTLITVASLEALVQRRLDDSAR